MPFKFSASSESDRKLESEIEIKKIENRREMEIRRLDALFV